jgi:hypothetical protein
MTNRYPTGSFAGVVVIESNPLINGHPGNQTVTVNGRTYVKGPGVFDALTTDVLVFRVRAQSHFQSGALSNPPAQGVTVPAPSPGDFSQRQGPTPGFIFWPQGFMVSVRH